VSTPLVEAEDLVLGYAETVAVGPSSFTLPRASVTAVIGPNGSGKSTLLHALAGILPLRGGTLRVLGLTPAAARPHTTYVMQTVTVAPGTPITVREVVAMGRFPSTGWFRPFTREDRARVQHAMDQLEISGLAGRHLGELSGGQRQRVYVAQGIAQEHELVLLDEPLTGLDITSARTIDRIIHSERDKGHSVILTTHDLDEARAADRVLLMSGRVVASGTPGEVLTRRNLEIAYGLGALHDSSSAFLDDPAGQHGAPDPGGTTG